MKLTLTYRGPLPPKQRATSQTKADLRAAFHPQIRAQVQPRLGVLGRAKVISAMDGHLFVSPAHPALRTAVELDVLLLAPHRAARAGDLDNRLKTLNDGLTRPANAQMMAGHVPQQDGEPTYCLMDDDRLLKRISVDARPWFEETNSGQDVLLIVTATIVLNDDADMTSDIANLFLVI